MLNHPDMGGNAEVMKRINIDYEQIKKQLASSDDRFSILEVGDTVIINGSISLIIATSPNTFTAKSEYSHRQAVFNNKTGICISNPKFRASIQKNLKNA